MKFHRISAIIMRHYYEAIHNFDRISDMIYWPVLDVIVWGFLTIYLSRSSFIGPTLVNFLLGATILWGVFFALHRDMAMGFLDELWSRNLLNLFSSPLSIWEYITGLVMINFVKMLVGFFAAALLAWAFYAFNIFPHAFQLLPYFVNLIFFGLALGIFITGLIFRYTTKVQVLAWSIPALLQPVSCVFYPLSTLPKFLQDIAWFLPTTHVFEGMREVLGSGIFSTSQFWWGFILNIIYMFLAILFFNMIFKISKDRGLIVKLE